MNLFGSIIFIILGVVIIIYIPQMLVYKGKNYPKFNKTIGKVEHMQDFCGNRWIVSFKDENGNEVLGMDDIISSYGTFSPNKYNLPKLGKEEYIYYWKYKEKSQYSINHQKVEYYIHFCNENLYELQKIKGKRNSSLAIILGLFFIVCGVLIIL